MAERIKKHLDIVLALGMGLTFAIWGMLGIMGTVAFPTPADAAQATVTVTATVSEWLTFDVAPTSVTLSPNLVDSAGVTKIASSSAIKIYLGTNSADGWSVSIRSKGTSTYGALVLDTATDERIDSVTGAQDVDDADNNDRYGANATSSYTGVIVAANYDYYESAPVTPVTVGQLLQATASTFINKVSANASTTVATWRIFAECDSAQDNGTYGDNVELTTTPNI